MAKRREGDFAVATPWLCAAVVLGIELLEKTAALAAATVVMSLTLLTVVLVGAALWSSRPRVRIEGQSHPTSPGPARMLVEGVSAQGVSGSI